MGETGGVQPSSGLNVPKLQSQLIKNTFAANVLKAISDYSKAKTPAEKDAAMGVLKEQWNSAMAIDKQPSTRGVLKLLSDAGVDEKAIKNIDSLIQDKQFMAKIATNEGTLRQNTQYQREKITDDLKMQKEVQKQMKDIGWRA